MFIQMLYDSKAVSVAFLLDALWIFCIILILDFLMKTGLPTCSAYLQNVSSVVKHRRMSELCRGLFKKVC